VQGKEISVSAAPPETSGAQVIDLMQALRASLGKQKAPPAAAAAAPSAAAEPEARGRKPPKRAPAPAEPTTSTRKQARSSK